ncbi:MAG TPA: hypothetical protein VKH20_01150 [Solirubrobacterales bacterium]|nr:hypothetical protein [Solirubrobacterales bacterium]
MALEIREFQLALLQRVSEFLVFRSPVGLDEDGGDCGGQDREKANPDDHHHYADDPPAYRRNRYRHLLDGQRERAAERLDAFLAGPQTGPQSLKPALLSGRN